MDPINIIVKYIPHRKVKLEVEKKSSIYQDAQIEKWLSEMPRSAGDIEIVYTSMEFLIAAREAEREGNRT